MRLRLALLPLGLALFAMQPVQAADDPQGFVRNRVSTNQSMGALLAGKFSFQAICKERCEVDARLVLPSAQAKELGFKGVRRGYYHEVGRVEDVELDPLEWSRLRIPLTAEARRRIRRAKGGVAVHGQVIAQSLESGRYGQASWIRTCRWPSR